MASESAGCPAGGSRLGRACRAAAVLRGLVRLAGGGGAARGDDGDTLYFVDRGRFTSSVNLQLGEGGLRQIRLATVTEGMCFGEIAFLSGQPRSADVIADQDSQCRVLHRRDFDHLRRDHPDTAIELLLALSGELSWRLSRTTRQLIALEQL